MRRESLISVAQGASLAAVLSLLWHFAVPVAPFDPFSADLGDAPTSSVTVLGYQHAFVTLGPAWLPSSLLITVMCLTAIVGAAFSTMAVSRFRTAVSQMRPVVARWWPVALSTALGLSVAAAAAIRPPRSPGFALVDPSSFHARMADSALFRDSAWMFTAQCLVASVLVGLLFTTLHRSGRRTVSGV